MAVTAGVCARTSGGVCYYTDTHTMHAEGRLAKAYVAFLLDAVLLRWMVFLLAVGCTAKQSAFFTWVPAAGISSYNARLCTFHLWSQTRLNQLLLHNNPHRSHHTCHTPHDITSHYMKLFSSTLV